MPNKPRDITGEKFRNLTAIRNLDKRDHLKAKLWLFKCDCGRECEKAYWSVLAGKIVCCNTPDCQYTKKKLKGSEAALYERFRNSYKDGNITFEQFKKLSQQNCHWCGQWRPNRSVARNGHEVVFHGLDRIDNNRPHDYDNVRPCCWVCNDRRSNDSEEEFIKWIREVYSNRCIAKA